MHTKFDEVAHSDPDHHLKPVVVALCYSMIFSAKTLSNYKICNLFRLSLLHQPWEQREYPPQFDDRFLTCGNPNILTHSRVKHCM